MRISKDLENPVFIGSIAVFAHIGPIRRTQDIDLALASTLSDQQLEEMGYRQRIESGKPVRRTPNGVKIDIYRKDVGGIPVDKIYATAETRTIFKNEKIRVLCLETLLLAKLRANRVQDNFDIQEICIRSGNQIKWNLMEEMATEMEITTLKITAGAFKAK